MQARKLRPEDISRPAVRIDLQEMKYDHAMQVSLIEGDRITMVTFNATQTFDSRGNPRDSDNDR